MLFPMFFPILCNIYIYYWGTPHSSHVFGGFLCTQSLTEPGSARGYNLLQWLLHIYHRIITTMVIICILYVSLNMFFYMSWSFILFSINHTLVIIFEPTLFVPSQHDISCLFSFKLRSSRHMDRPTSLSQCGEFPRENPAISNRNPRITRPVWILKGTAKYKNSTKESPHPIFGW
jgi:hypothetical protein